ncbi:MAG: sugar phosphate nucleotidyltransferase [Verrucomicrobiota bacterium]
MTRFEKSVFILAGGMGTRLQGITGGAPKVLCEFLGRPFLEFLLDQVAELGAKEVTLCTGYKAEEVSKRMGNSYRGMKLNYSVENEPLGTGGALGLAAKFCNENFAWIMNGDSYFAANFSKFNDWFDQKENADVGIALAQVDDVARFGSVGIDAHEKVLQFEEKGANTGKGWINAGIYIIKRELLLSIPQNHPVSIEKELFPAWLTKNFFASPTQGAFIDIGTPESYRDTERFLGALPLEPR